MVSKVANNEQILKEAEYYLNNDVTIAQASLDLNISKKTLQLHMKKLESIAPDQFKLVSDKKLANERMGKIKGGTLGKREPKWTKEQAREIANTMIDKQMTNREASEEFSIPKSTIYEMTHKGIDDETTESLLYALAEANRKGISLNDVLSKYYPEDLDKNIKGNK